MRTRRGVVVIYVPIYHHHHNNHQSITCIFLKVFLERPLLALRAEAIASIAPAGSSIGDRV
jgi:hypothetical protein